MTSCLGIHCSGNKLQEPLETLKRITKNSNVSYRHGACLIKGDKIISFGVNKYFSKIYYKTQDRKFTIHAEIDAILKLDSKELKGTDILIIRVSNCDNLCNSRPCNSCIDKLKKKGIRKAYYSNSDGKIVYEFVDTMPKLHTSSAVKYREFRESGDSI